MIVPAPASLDRSAGVQRSTPAALLLTVFVSVRSPAESRTMLPVPVVGEVGRDRELRVGYRTSVVVRLMLPFVSTVSGPLTVKAWASLRLEIAAAGVVEAAQRHLTWFKPFQRGAGHRAAGQGGGSDDAAGLGDAARRSQSGRGTAQRAVDRKIAGSGSQAGVGAARHRAGDGQGLAVADGQAGRTEVAEGANQVGAGQTVALPVELPVSVPVVMAPVVWLMLPPEFSCTPPPLDRIRQRQIAGRAEGQYRRWSSGRWRPRACWWSHRSWSG